MMQRMYGVRPVEFLFPTDTEMHLSQASEP